jgi:hypothetical protein
MQITQAGTVISNDILDRFLAKVEPLGYLSLYFSHYFQIRMVGIKDCSVFQILNWNVEGTVKINYAIVFITQKPCITALISCNCKIRSKLDTDSDLNWTPIPEKVGQSFRF